MNFYELITDCGTGMAAEPRWREQAIGDILCSTCNAINRSLYPRPIDVVLREEPPDSSTGYVLWAGAKVLHKILWKDLRHWLSDFTIGKCFAPDGKTETQFMTLYTFEHVIMRSNEETIYETCDECGGVSYIRGDPIHRYLLADAINDRHVVQTRMGSIYVSEEVRRFVGWKNWPDIELVPVPIRNDPIDGRDDLPRGRVQPKQSKG